MAQQTVSSLSSKEEQLVRLMQLLGDKTRYQIFKLIADNDRLCVSEIATRLGVSVSAISQHFKLLEENGIVTRARFGQKICYTVPAGTHATELLTYITKESTS